MALRLLVDKEGLWYRMLKARYGEVGGRIQEGVRRASGWWRTMCEIREGVGSGVGNWFVDNTRRVVGNGHCTYCWANNWVGRVPLRIKFRRLFDLALNRECTVEEMAVLGWEEGGNTWVWKRRLLAWEEECVRECSVLLSNVVLQDHIQDSWRWLLDPIQGYSIRGTYQFLTSSDEPEDMGVVHNV